MFGKTAGIVIALTIASAACSRQPPSREFELTGQVLAVDEARQEITIKHEDIKGFMPGMTMPFKVSDRRLLEGRVPGDLVKATLVVWEQDAHIRTLERIGHAPVPPDAGPPRPADILATGQPVADASFVDESGSPRTLSEWRRNVVAVTFMYTRCPLPNFCPVMDRHFKAVQEAVRADPNLTGRARLLSVSFDPEHDTPAVLSAHAARLQADPAVWHFVTGTAEDVDRFASQFGVSILRNDPGAADIVHNLRTAVIDGEGRLAAVFNGSDWTPAQLVTEMRHARGGR